MLSPGFFCNAEFFLSLLNHCWIVIVFWSLLIDWQPFAVGDVAVEIVTRWTYGDPIVIVRVSCRPPKFYPATMFSIEGYGVIPLCGWGFCVIAD